MKFNNQSYEEKFLQIFCDIIDTFKLIVEKADENTMILRSDKFILEIFITFDGAFVRYTDIINNKKYDISNFLAINTEDIDRVNLTNSDIISIYIEESLLIRARVLYRKFKDLLAGDMSWFDDYKKSEYFDDLS